jgi:hypothetical protein
MQSYLEILNLLLENKTDEIFVCQREEKMLK